MANSSEKPTYSLKLVIDDEKNRVVLAEAGKDFVDLLSDLLTLPMGTIVRLLEKCQNPQLLTVGCFNNLYRSVSIMDDDNFESEACKNLLLYPKSMKKANRRRLNLNVDDAAEETKFFVCPSIFNSGLSCRKAYSNFCTSICSCGKTMDHMIDFEGEEADEADGGLLSCRTSFIITEDMRVELNSMSLVMNVLNALGYVGFNKLREMVIDVSFEKVLALLGCMFTSEAPLTETFLTKHCMTKKCELFTPPVQETRDAEERVLTLKVFVRKLDGVVLYGECREEFVDFLFGFLAFPLLSAWELAVDNANMGFVGNFCGSMKGLLSFEKQKEATLSRCILPYYYNFRIQPLNVDILEKPQYECLISRYSFRFDIIKLSKKINKTVLSRGEEIEKLIPVSGSVGFVKGKTNFIVTDDLVVTPMNSTSTISLLSKLEMSFNDIEEHTISIGKAEAASILRASLITNSALTNGLSNFLSKMKSKRETESTKKRVKTEESC